MTKYFFAFALMVHLILDAVDFVLFTQPKTGTHLLSPILTELTGKQLCWPNTFFSYEETIEESFDNGIQNPDYIFFRSTSKPWKREVMDMVYKNNINNRTYLHLHAPYSPMMENYLAEKNCISFFVKRDPRDQLVSLLNHYKYIQRNDKDGELFTSDDEKLLYMIKTDWRKDITHFMGWLKSPVCCVLDFRKLMGAHGGAATDADALEEMRKIASALQLKLPNKRLLRVYKKHFGKGWCFFKGKVGSWKDYFNAEHKEAAKKEVGDLLIELGFERDYNW